jgi:hypothetical protein
MSGEDPLPGSQIAPSPSVLTLQRDKQAPLAFFIRALISVMRILSHDITTSQRPHLSIPSPLGLGFQYMN